MRRLVQTGLVAGGLLAAMMPGVASAAGNGPPDYLFGICMGRGSGGPTRSCRRTPVQAMAQS